MTTATYVRLSQNREGDEDKPQRQRDACATWLQTRGITAYESYEDDDLSAYKGKRRPAWNRLLADVSSGHVTHVVALHMDRLLRDMRELESLVDLVEQTGCRIDTIESGDLDLSTSAGRTMARILASISTGESERKGERHRSKAAQLRSQGKSTGGARPFGWMSPNGDLEPTEAAMIAQGIRSILEGGTLWGVRRQWVASGVTSSFGKAWESNKSVSRILQRWRNAGLVEHHDQLVGPAVWPAIPGITEAEITAVRAILRDPARRSSPGPARKNLLSGIATCEKCGNTLRKGAGPRHTPYYRCSGFDHGCHLSVRVAMADKVVSDEVRNIFTFTDPADFAADPADRDRLVELRTERSQIDSTMDDIAERVGSGEWPLAMADRALEGLKKSRADLDRTLALVTSRIATAAMLGDSAMVGEHLVDIEKAVAVGQRFDALSLDKRRAILREVFESVVVLPGRSAERVRITRRGQSALVQRPEVPEVPKLLLLTD